MGKFTVQCSRCDGKGRYDRGTCFTCKGVGYENKATQPRGMTPFVLTVTYNNGSKSAPKVWATRKEVAIEIVSRQLKINGWIGTVSI